MPKPKKPAITDRLYIGSKHEDATARKYLGTLPPMSADTQAKFKAAIRASKKGER